MLSAMNDASLHGAPVDWWFAYKLPQNQTQQKEQTPSQKKTPKAGEANGGGGGTSNSAAEELSGYNYLYFDPDDTSGLSLSPYQLGDAAGALHNTLDHIFSAAEKPQSEVGWLLYNDEMPYTMKNNHRKGHCKGVLAFNKKDNCGVWLLHSTPRFPVAGNPAFPVDERIYAQTFICITLDSYETACLIAGQLHNQQQPQVYAYKLPDSVASAEEQDEIYRLCCGSDAHEGALTSHIAFKSKAGVEFQSIAKNGHWGKDFWIDLVGPALKADLKVETWRRGKSPADEDSGVDLDVTDVGGIDLSRIGVPAGWHYTFDHGKWATSEEAPGAAAPGWVCVADLNRQVSQEKRGGGSICFRQQELWLALSSIEVNLKDAP